MNIQNTQWVTIGALNDIPRQGARRVIAGPKTIAIFRTTQDEVYALEDKCPFKDGPLSEGIVHGKTVSCPITNWVISLETGAAQGADQGQTQVFPIKLEGQTIQLGL
ncbi:tRNA-(guanine-N1)-methyltransferase [Amylibacter marinus]|uniref:tRNA-(Guanine-N1)-methyltransferase n=1 Tax=Amylibacter marinus TaxID=1475483 RepID=A0ABQ5VY61_9RHOB|nr:nitrite reductase small subunit NirD [Amylibacter marinus]GLQ36331.1 tRNA-(guanine-N1)-methyltransferase [Amylibacter marinus]